MDDSSARNGCGSRSGLMRKLIAAGRVLAACFLKHHPEPIDMNQPATIKLPKPDPAAQLRRTVKLTFTIPSTLANPWSGLHRSNIVRSR